MNLPEGAKEALTEIIWDTMGIDPDQEQSSGSRGKGIHTIFVLDYFRVEPLSSVLNFWAVVGTMIAAATGLVLAIASLT